MNFLALDTSGRRLTVAAVRGDAVALRDVDDCAMRHSVLLMDAVDSVLNEAGLTPRTCDFFACVVGPGSFTGIRIGISTVKGLCLASGRPALAVTSFDRIAYADRSGDPIAVVDAGHGKLYAQGYGRGSLPAGLYDAEEVAELSRKTHAPLLACEPCGVGETVVSAAEGLLRAARELCGRAAPAEELGALYLRKSAAEEGR